MKKLTILAIVLIAVTTFFSSCNRGCGGWYGDRNLRFSEAPTTSEVQQDFCDPQQE